MLLSNVGNRTVERDHDTFKKIMTGMSLKATKWWFDEMKWELIFLKTRQEIQGIDLDVREAYNQRRRYLLKRLEEMNIPCFEPEGAFYIFPNISKFGMSSEEFCTKLLTEEKVAVVPGTAFGQSGEGFVRISYAYSLEQLREAMGRIQRFVERHAN